MHRARVVMLHHEVVINHVSWRNRGNVSYYISKNPFLSYPVFLFVKKGHPYSLPLKHFSFYLMETGIDSYWARSYRRLKPKVHRNKGFKILSNKQLAFCWILMVVGWFSAITVFLTEVIMYRLKFKKILK